MNVEILKLDDVSIGFNDPLVKNISAEILSGKIIALMGNNGQGKSCLIKTICQYIPIHGGNIDLLGKSLENYNQLDFSKIISVLLTEKINVENLLVDELISLARAPFTNWLGEFEEKDCQEVYRAIKILNIENLLGKYFSNLSDGQKQKVLLARAIAQSPKLLILDEPTTYLDIPSKIEFLNNLKKITTESGTSILMSTHELFLIKDLVDEIWLIDNSKLFKGSPAELIEAGHLNRVFGLNLS